MNRLLPWSALLLLLPVLGCPTGDDDDSSVDDDGDSVVENCPGSAGEFTICSPDMVEPYFEVPDGRECPRALPVANACDGPNPEIRWDNLPAGTVALALIFDDPTAGGFDHWAIFNIDAGESGLDAGISGDNVANDPPGDAVELVNGFGWEGYLGSCPGGVNRYSWRLYALSETLDAGITTYGALETAAEDASLGMAEMCHVFDGGQLP